MTSMLQTLQEKDPLPPLVIYHANCMDGFTAAWCAWKHFGRAAHYRPMSYGEDVFDSSLNDRLVYILDFSFQRKVLTAMASLATQVVLLDHHKTAEAELADWSISEGRPANLSIIFDQSKSGAGLAWKEFQTPYQLPPLIQYVQDRDLWKFEFWKSKEINAYIAAQDRTFEAWESLHQELERELTRALTVGTYLLKQHSTICDQIVAQQSRTITIEDSKGIKHYGLQCNCTGQFASDVGNILAERSGTFGATWYTAKDGSTKWSLRSIGDYDVSSIAASFGGGGHKNAAGFQLFSPTEESEAILWAIAPGAAG